MATYAELSDVEARMAQFELSVSSSPKREQAQAILDDTEAEVNTIISGADLVVPVTTPDYFLGWVKNLVIYGATAAILKSMFPSAIGSGENPAWAFWESRYRRGLDGLKDGSLIPPDAPTSSTPYKVTPNNYFTSRGTDCEAVPWFRRRTWW